jgi:hypothetical protein
LERRIAWRNYYDLADPVGFDLNTARDWLAAHGWNKFFEFEPQHDFGFARYFVPGKAHNDYWNDPHVFGHFIRDVLKLSPSCDGEDFAVPPPSRKWARILAYLTPSLLVAGLLYAAVYFLYAATNSYLSPSNTTEPIERGTSVITHVAGITLLLLGTTLASRIPCLTRTFFWKCIATVGFIIGAFLYVILTAGWLTHWSDFFKAEAIAGRLTIILSVFFGLLAVGCSIWSDRHKKFLQRWPPLRLFAKGMRPMLIAGGLAAAALVGHRIFRSPTTITKPFWPVLLAGAAFIYLWWLAAILFDLFFAWHRYIRRPVLQNYLRLGRRQRIKDEHKQPEATPAAQT